jgi:hypothetical protein
MEIACQAGCKTGIVHILSIGYVPDNVCVNKKRLKFRIPL